MHQIEYHVGEIREGDVEFLNIGSSPEIRGTIIQEEEFIVGTGEAFTPSMSQKGRKRSSTKVQSSGPQKIRRIRASTAAEATNIEIPILNP